MAASHVPIGTRSTPALARVQLELLHRFQSYNNAPKSPQDVFDADIFSPKSVRCHGNKAFINSLEGMKTVVYSADTLEKIAAISHTFDARRTELFDEVHIRPFSGKPVESALSHAGRFLWVPYYRRDYDTSATLPSAIAVIDTNTLAIERVLSTGPIAKYALASPDGKHMVVSNWGNNTLSVFDIASADPADFHLATTLVVDHILDTKNMDGDRDKKCGYCLRGLAFTKDSRYLFVARMGGGGVAVFDFGGQEEITYLGTVYGFKPTPRDIQLSPDGKSVFISSNISGYVTHVPTQVLVDAAKKAVRLRAELKVLNEVYVGGGARSIRLSKDGRYLFAAIHANSEVAVVDATALTLVARVPVDSFPVGLDLSPDDTQLWVTSQGANGKGGNSVNVYRVRYTANIAKQ